MRITSAKPLPEYRLELQFEDGQCGVVDLSPFVGRGVFTAWEDPKVFTCVSISDEGALEWPGEIDLCPDALYLQMTGKRAEEIFPAMQHPLSHA
jgi:hypothetical protein